MIYFLNKFYSLKLIKCHLKLLKNCEKIDKKLFPNNCDRNKSSIKPKIQIFFLFTYYYHIFFSIISNDYATYLNLNKLSKLISLLLMEYLVAELLLMIYYLRFLINLTNKQFKKYRMMLIQLFIVALKENVYFNIIHLIDDLIDIKQLYNDTFGQQLLLQFGLDFFQLFIGLYFVFDLVGFK